MEKRIILILDKLDYKNKENEYLSILKKKYSCASIVYTEYENELIRKVRKWRYIGSALQHLLYWKKSYDYAKNIYGENADIVICINPIVGIFLGMMNRSRKTKIILCGFLFEPKKNRIYYILRKRFVEKCLKGVEYAVVYARQEVAYYQEIFGLIDKFRFIPYGIDYMVEDSYQGELPEEYIFSGGGSNRDYATLVEAYNLLNESERPAMCIATMPRCLEGLNIKNINVLTDVVLENFGSVMKQSKCLVLSLKDTEISAGHQVMLEALKNNVPIIVNRIKAIEDYVSEQEVVFYESGNVQMLAECIKNCINSPKNRNTYDIYAQKYSFKMLLDRLIDLT